MSVVDSMQPPPIAFCITCKGRTQHLELTLPRNLEDNACYPNLKFVLVDYSSPDHLASYIRERHADAIASGRLVVYQFTEPGPFRMAHAKNLSHRLGILEGAKILVNLDADNFTGKGFAHYVAEQFAANGDDSFLWSRMIKEGPDRTARGISGRIAVTPRMFRLVGGYNEKYETWSPDDKDFNARLRRLGFTAYEIDKQYLTEGVPHNDKMRFKEYKHAAEMDEESFKISETDTVVNYGKFGCGVVYRNYTSPPIEMTTVPTRVFGIGMHRTATTSLHAALDMLSLDSAHWKSAPWAKHIWSEMNNDGRSTTLERNYALTDLPIPLLYEKLDKAYPGSKFILTTRNEKDWLESVRKHWSTEHNRFRTAWDTDVFTHKVHSILYGRRDFDADTMLARFLRHNLEVQAYFRHRKEDLLVLDIDQPQMWPALCGFLRQPIPDVPYPNWYRSKVNVNVY